MQTSETEAVPLANPPSSRGPSRASSACSGHSVKFPSALKTSTKPPRARRNVTIGRKTASIIPFTRGTGLRPRAGNKARHTSKLTSVSEDARDEVVLEDFDANCSLDAFSAQDGDSEKSSIDQSHRWDGRSYRSELSRGSSRTSLCSSILSSQMRLLAEADMPLPFAPLCGKCPSLRPTDSLVLKPEGLTNSWRKLRQTRRASQVEEPFLSETRSTDADHRAENVPSSPLLEPTSPHSPNNEPVSPKSSNYNHRKSRFDVAMSMTMSTKSSVNSRKSLHRCTVASLQEARVMSAKKWAMKLESLHFQQEHVPKSRFTGCGVPEDEREYYLNDDGKHPPVMRLLTPFETALLECWTIQHLKRQYAEISILSNMEAPRIRNRYKENMYSATICQLVRKARKGKLDDVEHAFMLARLSHYPLLNDLPQHLLPEAAELLEVRSFARGQTLFERRAAVDGIYILVQGDVEFLDGDNEALSMGTNIKEAPAAILFEDIIQVCKERPFLLKHPNQRIRSRTVQAWDDEDASTSAMTLWLPISLVVKAANHWRRTEASDTVDLINTVFAPAMRLDKRLCERYCHLFDVSTFPKSHSILQQGVCPPIDSARLFMVLEGEVRLVRLEKGKGASRKSIKDTAGHGRLLGENALYGEPFPHYAVCHTNTVKVLSIRVWDFFEKLLQRNPTHLDKPLICAGTLENRVGNDGVQELEVLDKIKESVKKSRELVLKRQRDFRVSHDVSFVMASEWKTVPEKYMLRWRQPPSARPNKAVSGVDREEPSFNKMPDFTYPSDFDLFPSVQRSVAWSAQRCSSPDRSTTVPSATSVTTFALSGTDSIFASLDGRIRREVQSSEELEAEHYLHTALGMYVEDAERRPQSEARRATPHKTSTGRSSSLAVQRPQTHSGERPGRRTPRSAVLLTCGAFPHAHDKPPDG